MTEEVRIATTLERVATICEKIEQRLEGHEVRFEDHERRIREVEGAKSGFKGAWATIGIIAALVGPTIVYAVEKLSK